MVHGCKVNPLVWSIFGWSQSYWVRLKGSYVVARIFFLLLLNCSAWACLVPA